MAVRLAERQPYDLIMGDYDLPEVDGLELLEQIVATRCQVPALTVAGQDGEEVAVLARMAGVCDHIVKCRSSEPVEAVWRMQGMPT